MSVKILTPSGYQDFDGVQRIWHDEVMCIRTVSGKEIHTSPRHVFMQHGMNPIFAEDLKVGWNIGEDSVAEIARVKKGMWLYDPLNVGGGHVFVHDGSCMSHNSFNQTSSTLIDMEFLIGLSAESPLENSRDNLKFYEAPQDDHQYVMTVDVAKGRGIDYSTFSVIDITQTPMKQVATYRDNLVSPLSFPSLLYKIGKAYNDAYVIVEANAGEVVHKILQYDLEYENIYTSKVVNGRSLGLEMNKKVKRIGCSNLKDLIEQRQLVIPDEDTIRELCVFEAKGESFEARKNEHDDMVMTLVMFAWFADTNIFGYLGTDQLRTLMGDESKALSNSSTPFLGFLDEESANPIYENWDIDASDSSLWRFEEVNRGWDLGNRRKEDEYLF